MRINKKYVTVATAVVIGVTGVAGIGMASAASSSNSDPNNLVDKIASTFHLDKSKVQAVFDENRAEHDANRQAKLEEKLAQAVKDGKLTKAQKSAILAKVKEIKSDMEANHDAMKDKTPAEHKAAMEQKRVELEQWAKDNNIPTKYLRFFMMGGPGHHHVMMERTDDSAEQQ
jgi:hypothetical protein